jgi:dipeptidase D
MIPAKEFLLQAKVQPEIYPSGVEQKIIILPNNIHKMQTLQNLKPEKVWEYFSEILQIPRPSKKEEKILAYIRQFAEKNNLAYNQDNAGNIIITKPASPGYENKRTLILQSHVDMVCEKNEETHHDFETDAIQSYIQEGWLKSKGTTLGADNGIGVAIQLALLADRNAEHGTLECLFTVDEESGMTGAFAIENTFLSGRMLINLDSEEEGEIYIGCAGGIDTLIYIPVTFETPERNYKFLNIQVKGLFGGHSGDDINKGRGNAIKLIIRLLWNLSQQTEYRICSLRGGNLRNAIPRESSAIITFHEDNFEEVLKIVEKQRTIILKEYKNEPGLSISSGDSETWNTCLNSASQNLILSCLHACPNGVIEMSKEIPDLVETSTNLASIRTHDHGEIEIVSSQRSSIASAKYHIASRIRGLFGLAGAKVIHTDSYPGWTPNPDSELLKIIRESYRRLYGKDPEVRAIHAGLECGLFIEKYPDLDMVSIGPTIKGAHSPDERVEIQTVEKFWSWMLDIIKSVPDK